MPNIDTPDFSLAQTQRCRVMVPLLLALVCVVGCSSAGKRSATAAVQAIPTDVVRSISRKVPVVLSETGSFIADESSDVAPAVSGRVIRTPVSVGQFVKAGQVICELDHQDAQFKLTQMQAQLAEAIAAVRQSQQRIGLGTGEFHPDRVPDVAAAKANYEASLAQAKLAATDARRYANLVTTGDVSESVYDQKKAQSDTASAQADQAQQQYEGSVNGAKLNFQVLGSSQASLDAMKAQVLQAQKNLGDATIRAPFDGYVSARPVAVGEFVATSAKVATIVRIDTLKLQMQIPESRAAALTVGMPVMARVVAYGDRDFNGVTSAVNPSVNPDSRAFVLEARFPNKDITLRPGMFSTAQIVLLGTENAIFLPQAAVIRDRTTDSNQVFIVENGKAHLRIVTLGDTDSGQVRVLSGLAPGELAALTRQADLYDGAPVTPHLVR
jgi:multidrug efflux pump subunit AcrA (membrane-fusion protein)